VPAPQSPTVTYQVDAPDLESPDPPTPSPVAPASLAHQMEIELRQPPPPPPRYPLWSGIYSFPWRKENLWALAFLTFTFTVFALALAFLRELFDALEHGSQAGAGIGPVLAFLAILFFSTGIWASNMFLAVVNDTAAGCDRVTWMDLLGVLDGVWNLFYLVWLVSLCSLPILALRFHFIGTKWWVAAALISIFLFPVVFLSSLAGDTAWEVLDRRVIAGFLRRPQALLLVSMPVLSLVLPLIWLGTRLDPGSLFELAIFGGVVWAAAFLIYARLLGRAAWLLSLGLKSKKANRKPKKKKPKLSTTTSKRSTPEGAANARAGASETSA
jgi:hypothetical protein